jgi:hypothetical protein
LDCEDIAISLAEAIDPESIDLSAILRHEINRRLDRHMVFLSLSSQIKFNESSLSR